MSKQDRQGVRTPADLERKYNLGGAFAGQNSNAKLAQQVAQLSQTLSQYIANSNAAIEELVKKDEEQSIVVCASGEELKLSDCASRNIKSLVIHGKTVPATDTEGEQYVVISKVWTSNEDSSLVSEAILTEAITLKEGDMLEKGVIIRALETDEGGELPSADAEAIKSLKTFKLVTNVFTDSAVVPVIDIEYVADTKTYIDNLNG